MPLASAARVGLSYVAEVTQGVTPAAPTMKRLRNTQRSINPSINTLESNEGREDRQVADMRHGFNSATGTVGFELGSQSYDDMLEAAMGGTWAAVVVAGGPDFGATSPNLFTRSAGSFTADGFRIGDTIRTASFANPANNGTWVVTAVGTTTITVLATTLVTVAAAGGRTLVYPGKRLDIGSTLKTFTFERRFSDVPLYEVYRGVAVNQLTVTATPEQMVTCALTLLGLSFGVQSGTSLGTPTAAPTTSPFSAFDGIFIKSAVENAACTSLEFTLNNNRTTQGVIGSRFSPEVFEGDARVSGSISAFMADAVDFNNFFNEDEIALSVRFDDLDGVNFMTIVVPRLKISSNEKDPPRTGPIVANQAFMGLVHATYNTTMTIQRSNT